MNPASTGNPPEPTSDAVLAHPDPAAGAQYPGTVGAGPQPGWTPGYPYPYVLRRPTNGMAIAAMVTGIVALLSCQLVGIVAIYLAKRARTEIETSGEEGSGFATAGLVLGWIGVGLSALVLLFMLVYFGFVGVLIATTANSSG